MEKSNGNETQQKEGSRERTYGKALVAYVLLACIWCFASIKETPVTVSAIRAQVQRLTDFEPISSTDSENFKLRVWAAIRALKKAGLITIIEQKTEILKTIYYELKPTDKLGS